ncbi:MAG: cold adaptation protein AtcA [Shewanella sp.]
MAKKLNISRINELKNNAYDNIESYNDPDTPKALEQFTTQIKQVLLADPAMLASVPEYLPVALFGRVKFPSEAKLKWAHWINTATQPEWDEFKVTIGFNNADLPLVLAVRAYSESLLIESCAVLYLLETQGKAAPVAAHDDEDDDDYMGHADDDDEGEEEEGYYDHYDDEDR